MPIAQPKAVGPGPNWSGVQLSTGAGVTVIGNAVWPLNRGGLRANVIWTVGGEYSF